jgi:biotin carboxyl carrier protein
VRYRVVVEGLPFEVEIAREGRVWVNGRPYQVDLKSANGQPYHSLLIDNRSYETHSRTDADGNQEVLVEGRPYRTRLEVISSDLDLDAVERSPTDSASMASPARVTAPLPGVLVEVRVSPGDHVSQGDLIAVLESMKMHIELSAPHDGVVRSLTACAGREVNLGEELAVIW